MLACTFRGIGMTTLVKNEINIGVYKYPYIYMREKGMATHSSILAWRIPWREEPGRLWSMGSRRVGRD